FPDGGLQAWLNVAGASAGLFVSFGWINCVGVFQEYYQTHQLAAYTPADIAWISSLQIFFMMAGGLIVGKFFDNYGPRYLLLLGSFMHVFGLMMTSLATKYYHFILAQAICSAIGASMIFYCSMNSTTTWFFKKRGAALGLVTAGSSLGGVILPIMVTKLIPQIGYAWTMRTIGFTILGLLVFSNLTVRSRLPPNKRPFALSNYIAPFKQPGFCVLTAAVFFFYWGMFTPFVFIVSEARSFGMDAQLAQYLVAILNGASILGRTLPNAIADKVGRFNVMIIMSFATTILILALWLPATGNAPLILFAAFFGFSSGAGISLTPVLVAQVSPIKDIGVWTGSLMAFGAISALTGSPIGGAILTASGGDFTNAQIFSGVATGVGACLFVVARVVYGG
ncbi:major facilitator superfamily transporter, partial [Pseudovirgaria hyperparasitica]